MEIVYKVYEGTDWKPVLYKSLNEDYEKHGLNSKLNQCTIGYGGDISKMSKNDVEQYIFKAKLNLPIGQGVIYKGKMLGYLVCSTFIHETDNIPGDASWWLSYGKLSEATLLSDQLGQWQAIACGSLTEMEKKAHVLLREHKYEYKYYIITRDKNYVCSGNISRRKATISKTDSTYLVTPYYEYKIICRLG